MRRVQGLEDGRRLAFTPIREAQGVSGEALNPLLPRTRDAQIFYDWAEITFGRVIVKVLP